VTALRQGDRGPAVAELQRNLALLGYEPGDPDGGYGPRTRSAVLAFQLDYTDVDDDGVAGPQTLAKIAQALRRPDDDKISAQVGVPCNDETWRAFERLVDVVTKTPIRYGPGRGLWHGDRFVITHGPGQLGAKSWKNALGKSYPSFHCSSCTNFFLGWLLRRNELYTHAGNIPDLVDLLTKDSSLHQNPGAGPWRGYGEACARIDPNGSAAKRSGVAGVVDARELLVRVEQLPTFIVCGQSTRQRTGARRWWHHTVLFVARGGRLFRIAADGYRTDGAGYSATPMKYVEVNAANVATYDTCVYRAYGVMTSDGAYGDRSKPIAAVDVET
jgi:hypothetical protein